MSSLHIPEFDPSFQDQSLLHVIVRLPENISGQFIIRVKEKFPDMQSRYDKEEGECLLIADKNCEAGAFLPRLAETVREFSEDQPGSDLEIVETRMAVPAGVDSRQKDDFSRFIAVNADDSIESPKKFRLKMVGSKVFGSGTHPSTRLAAMVLEHLYSAGSFPRRVLDVGCGSGILSFAACLFGAREVSGIDISSEAISIAEKNKRLNWLDCRMDFSGKEVSDISQTFDLVVANVTTAVMSGMLNDFSRLAGNGGKLVMSGLQGRQQREIAEKMRTLGFRVSGVYGEDQWRAMLLAPVDVGP